MLALFIMPSVILGIWVAFFLVGYAMITITDPYDRVAFLLSILATDFVALALATWMFGSPVSTVLFSFLLTKCLVWSMMNHRNVVHYQVKDDEE